MSVRLLKAPWVTLRALDDGSERDSGFPHVGTPDLERWLNLFLMTRARRWNAVIGYVCFMRESVFFFVVFYDCKDELIQVVKLSSPAEPL